MPVRSPRAPVAAEPLADVLPVARVLVELPLAHLDRPFDYAVPASMADRAVAGARVKVRVAGQLLDGYVLERRGASDFGGTLHRLAKVVSAEPVLTPQIAELTRRVADRYAGVQADVLRLAVPPRVAKVETAVAGDPPPPPAPPSAAAWAGYDGGPELIDRLGAGEAPRAVWGALPGADWAVAVAVAVQATLSVGRGALVVVPDAADLARVDAALRSALGDGLHTVLTADAGPAERYRRWLAVRRGTVRAVVGTRAAMFAPVHDLGLLLVWDDGDDLHAEPRAPYPHVREVLALRAVQEEAAFVIGGFARTAEAQQAVAAGWARPVVPHRDALRAAAPHRRALGDDAESGRDRLAVTARLPRLAWETVRDGLRDGPVLVQVPRTGAAAGLSCATCRTRAACASCGGSLTGAAPGQGGWTGSALSCTRCGTAAEGWRCPVCAGSQLRAAVVGVRRTAQELQQAFPRVDVVTSSGESRLATVPGDTRLVLATPGTEPVAAGGYSAALLLDGWALLSRPDLRAGEEALRRWLNAAALVRSGGRVVVAAEASLPAVQALLRWDPAWYAERELADRAALRFPPAARMAAIDGTPAAMRQFLADLEVPQPAEVSGELPTGEDGRMRTLVRVPRRHGAALAQALQHAQATQSAAKRADSVRVQLDPVVVG